MLNASVIVNSAGWLPPMVAFSALESVNVTVSSPSSNSSSVMATAKDWLVTPGVKSTHRSAV